MYCDYCQLAPEALYWAHYYTGYYSTYYNDYYAQAIAMGTLGDAEGAASQRAQAALSNQDGEDTLIIETPFQGYGAGAVEGFNKVGYHPQSGSMWEAIWKAKGGAKYPGVEAK